MIVSNGCGPFKSLVSWRMACAIRSVSFQSQLSDRADAAAELLGRQFRPIQSLKSASSLFLLVICLVQI